MDEVTGFRALGRHVRDREDAALPHSEGDEAHRQRLADAAATRLARARSRRRWRLGAALLAAATVLSATAAVLLARVDAFSAPLTFTLEEPIRPGVPQEWVSARAGAKARVRFSDGSSITLDSGARGRVVSLAPRGAEFVIEAGSAAVAVVPNAKADYRIRTGPFVVHVHGTRFTLEWDPVRDAFSLALYEGHVTVSGCVFGSGRAVEAGEIVRASCSAHTVSESRLEQAEPTALAAAPDRPSSGEPPAAAAPPAAEPPAKPAVPASKREAPAAEIHESWVELARAGFYERAYTAASVEGISRELRSRGPEEVFLLGDVARHAGHVEQAQSAYEVARQRFSGSETAANAAFALGRLAFDATHDPNAAARWFETYLAERPRGPLSSTALGRLLEARVALGQATEARSVASRYLTRYPNGPLAHEARKVLGSGG